MSIVLYHARVDDSTLAALRANPELFWDLPNEADPAGNQRLYTDKDWSALCWLLSAKAREEQKYDIVSRAVDGSSDLGDRDAWQAAMAQEAAKRGFELVDTDAMPDDAVLRAIHGRGALDSSFPKIGFGPSIFVPEEVAALSAALDRITESDLREHFDPQVMESLDVAGILWTEEEPDVFEKILVPVFEDIRIFFRLAAWARQHVLVVLT